MKMTTPQRLLDCLRQGVHVIEVDEGTAERARRAVERMIAIGSPRAEVSELRSRPGIDVLVVGSGIAGLSVAVALAGRCRVALISKETGGGGSTQLAQGGIAAPIGPGDSSAAHAADTVAAAAGLGDPRVAGSVIAEAAAAVELLADLGVRFDRDALAKEGGHSFARVVHARVTPPGAEITRALLEAASRREVPADAGPLPRRPFDRSRRLPGDRCPGVGPGPEGISSPPGQHSGFGHRWVRPSLGVPRPAREHAAATGWPRLCGRGHRWPTSSSCSSTRPAWTSAWTPGPWHRRRCGGGLPGCGTRRGAYLHPAGPEGSISDLSPRDVVSRSMARRMNDLGTDHCYLDATPIGAGALEARFPTFVAGLPRCRPSAGERLGPRFPHGALHPWGVLTDAEAAHPGVGLMAVGEVASTDCTAQPSGVELVARRA